MKSTPTLTSTVRSKGRCLKCMGLLVREWFDDLWWGQREEGLRCVNCGHCTNEQEQRLCELKVGVK